MTSQSNTPPNSPGWRPGTPSPSMPSATSAPSASPTEPAWRHSPPPTAVPPRVRVARLAGVLGLVFGTATALIWLILWLAPPGPACLVLASAGYEDNLALPANPEGPEAASRLARLAGTSSPLSRLFDRAGRLRLVQSPQTLTRGGDWSRKLDDAREKTIIVFLGLHGSADSNGAFLLPQDAGPDPDDRIRLQAVLDRLAELPASRNKLLLLDATGMVPVWSMGLLENAFARALADMEDRIAAIPNLVVISSSDIDQRSWPAADLRTTLFGRHLLGGLAGKAKVGTDNRLDAWDLFRYLAQKVEADAARLHGVLQRPVLLPKGEGESRARAIPLTFLLDESAVEGEPTGNPVPDIEAAWAGYDGFRPRASAARACVPGSWKLWQAWLERYQRLRLAGSPQSALALDKVRASQDSVLAGLDLQLGSAEATLSMPSVQGETQLQVPDPYPPFEDLWQAAPPDRRAVWQRLRKSQPEGMLRNHLYTALLQRTAENPARHLDRAADLATFLDDPVVPTRPAEVQFLVALARDRAVKVMPDELNLAIRSGLQLRVAAERAALAVAGEGYAYPERIRPWIDRLIGEADGHRQLGQDLLFGSDRMQWQQARGHFEEAARLYRQAQSDSTGLRESLTACDRAAAELPVFARFVSESPGTNEELVTLTMQLYDELRQLEQMTLEVFDQREAARVAAMRQKAQVVQKGLDQLQVRLDAYAQTCESTRSSPVRDSGVVLTVPWLESGQRNRLLQRMGRLGQWERSESEANVAIAPGQFDEGTLTRGIREGRLALAALGRSWFDQAGKVPYADVEPFVRRPDLEGQGARVLRWAGDQIGERFRAYPGRAEQLVRQAQKQQQVAGPLRQADRVARRFDAGQWQVLTGENAPVLARKADVENLLVWQARRTWTDHWYAEDGTTKYYQIVGIGYLRDARRLDPFGRPDAPGAEAVRKELDATDGIVVAAPAVRSMIAGDHLNISAGMNLAPGAAVVPGYPLLWAKPGDRLTFGKPADANRAIVHPGNETERLLVTLTSPELMKAEEAPPLEATAERSDVVWEGFYRGQKPQAQTPILLYPVPESTRLAYPRPPQAGVVVQADNPLFTQYGRGRGGLVIVFDVSGSEGPGEANRPANAVVRSRFTQAIGALRQILRRVPRGTRLSLWVFGQAVPPRNTAEKAEDTIRQLREPAAWDGETAVDGLVSQVEALQPWNMSPIARAVLRAREDVVKANGFREMILISDGDDNRFAEDREANPQKEPIPEVLNRRFAGSDIALHVVGFRAPDGKPEAELTTNFGFVAQREPKGTVTTVADLDPLFAAMSRAMRPSLGFRLVPDGDTSGNANTTEAPLTDVSHIGDNDRWQLVTGRRDGYRLQVPGLEFDQRAALNDGDLVLLRLTGGDPGWRRLVWSKQDPYSMRPARQTGGWRAAILQNQQLGARALQMLLAVEQESPQPQVIREVRPAALWLEVSPKSSKALPAVRWGEVTGYPAPTWGVEVPGWPITAEGPAAPTVRTWWGDPTNGASLLLRRVMDFASPEELKGERRIGAEAFSIDGVEVGEHWVQVSPDRREKRWCFVLGATHPVGKPVWAAIEGVRGLAGQEHRHFEAAGRYVGLFWFADSPREQEVRRRLAEEVSGIRFVSVPLFKEAMDRQKQTAAFLDLDTPAALPPRPRPAWGSP